MEMADMLDWMDWKILMALEADGRMSFGALGDQVGLSKTPCWTRVQRLEREGFIAGYHAAIDRKAVGIALTSFCEVTVEFAHHASFEAAIIDHPAVLECYTVAGQGDYLLIIAARGVEHLDQILRAEISGIAGVVRSSTTIGLKAIKQSVGVTKFASQARDLNG